MPIKFLLLGGVLGFFRRGGGSANFIFMGARFFRSNGGAPKGAEKASCGETVVQKGVFAFRVSSV